MVIFKLLTDIVANAGILLFVWEMVRVVRILSRPDPDGVEQIIGALKRLQVMIDRLSTRLGKVVPFPGTEEQHETTEAANE
jgi:hypothetical protein